VEVTRNDSGAGFAAWAKLSFTYAKTSESLPLRLCGWEVLEDVLREAAQARPVATRYRVQGAGIPEVNGIYEFSGNLARGDLKWSMSLPAGAASNRGGSQESGVASDTLTLFQCSMQTSSHPWWFLSACDPRQPGTADDIDYYKHSDPEQRHSVHPPHVGWLVCAARGERGRAPPPRLQRLESLPPTANPSGGAQQQSPPDLAKLLVEEVRSSGCVAHAFGDSAHREVVARSGPLLQFLAESGALEKVHVDDVWRMATAPAQEVELVDEALNVLASVTTAAPNHALLVHLLQRATAPLRASLSSEGEQARAASNDGGSAAADTQELDLDVDDDNDDGGGVTAESIQHASAAASGASTADAPPPPPATPLSRAALEAAQAVAMALAVKLAAQPFAHETPPFLPSPNDAEGSGGGGAGPLASKRVVDALLAFLWPLLCLTPSAWTARKQPKQPVVDLLQRLLRRCCASTAPHVRLLEDCLQHLRSSASALSSASPPRRRRRGSDSADSSNGNGSSATGAAVDEGKCLEAFSRMELVLGAFPSSGLRAQTVEHLQREQGFDALLTDELAAWVARNTTIASPAATATAAAGSATPVDGAGAATSAVLPPPPPSSETAGTPPGSPMSLDVAYDASSKQPINGLSSSTSGESSGVSRSSQLEARLHLWASVYAASSKVRLSEQQLRSLWELLRHPPYREACLRFLHSALRGAIAAASAAAAAAANGPSSSFAALGPSPLLGQAEMVFVYQDLLCGQDAGWSELGSDAYACFRAYRATFSGQDGSNSGSGIGSGSHEVASAGVTEDRGLEALWRIVLQSSDYEVASAAEHDLLAVYNNFSVPASLPVSQTRFLERALDHLVRAHAALQVAHSGDHANHDVPAAVVNVAPSATNSIDNLVVEASAGRNRHGEATLAERPVVRTLELLRGAVAVSRGPITVPHALRSTAGRYPVKVLSAKRLLPAFVGANANTGAGPAAGAASGPGAATHVQVMPGGNRVEEVAPFVLQVHPLETLQSLRLRVRDVLAPQFPVQCVRLFHAPTPVTAASTTAATPGRPLTRVLVDDATTVLANGKLKHGVHCFAQLTNGGPPPAACVTTEEALLPPVAGMRPLGDIMASNAQLFATLFSILQSPHCGAATARAVWELLLFLPTQAHVETAMSALANGGDAYAARVLPGGIPTLTSAGGGGGAAPSPHTGWEAVLRGGQWHRAVYVLQVVDALLQPAPREWLANGSSSHGLNNSGDSDTGKPMDVVDLPVLDRGLRASFDFASSPQSPRASVDGLAGGDEGASSSTSSRLKAHQAFKRSFVASGGLAATLDFFMTGGRGASSNHNSHSHAPSSSAISSMGSAVALRILRFCLFGDALSGSDSAIPEATSPGQQFNDLPSSDLNAAVLARPFSSPAPSAAQAQPPSPQNTSPRAAATAAAEALVSSSSSDGSGQAGGATSLAPFSERVVAVALEAQRASQQQQTLALGGSSLDGSDGALGLLLDAVSTLGDALKVQPALAETLARGSSHLRDLMVELLLQGASSRARRAGKALCLKAMPASLAGRTFGWLAGRLPQIPLHSTTCQPYFDVLTTLVARGAGSQNEDVSSSKSTGTGSANSSSTHIKAEDRRTLAVALVRKLAEFSASRDDLRSALVGDSSATVAASSSSTSSDSGNGVGIGSSGRVSTAMLRGCLGLLRALVSCDPSALDGTPLQTQLVPTLVHDFLFALPAATAADAGTIGSTTTRHGVPVCQGNAQTEAALDLLEAAAAASPHHLESVVEELGTLAAAAQDDLASTWHLDVAADQRPPQVPYEGLKNQGCTCYLNSAVQQLFMIAPLRRAILSAEVAYPVKIPVADESFAPDELVGLDVSVECRTRTSKTEWRAATVVAFDDQDMTHVIQYHDNDDDNGSGNKRMARFLLGVEREASSVSGPETGKAFVVRSPHACAPSLAFANDPLGKPAEATHVLEELQRTFMHLQASEKRAFDPRPLVAASKALGLEYNVFQQNDASEFYDKLMSKLEDALCGTEAWPAYQASFGMQVVNQSIPKERTSEFSAREKKDSLMQVELKVQGMDSVEESLQDLVKDEVMDGDNKIAFDNGKEEAKLKGVRRTTISTLPNVLVLHLKRFDLDYNTFETVKLNGRCSFPLKLNMMPYTKAGREAADDAAAATSSGSASTASPGAGLLDPEDFTYELVGVLIHLGMAQSGHYYSFIKDRATQLWYKFDDDDVTPWDGGANPEAMERECFGGTATRNVTRRDGTVGSVERELIANALMVFYDKVRPVSKPDPSNSSSSSSSGEGSSSGDSSSAEGNGGPSGSVKAAIKAAAEARAAFESSGGELVSLRGQDAYAGAVQAANLRFRRFVYLLDLGLHRFVRKLLAGAAGVRVDGAGAAPPFASVGSTDATSQTALEDASSSSPSKKKKGSAPPHALLETSTASNPGNFENFNSALSNRSGVVAGPTSALQLQVLQFGLRFLLDAALHATATWNMKVGGRGAWVACGTAALSAHPALAAWFLDQLACDPRARRDWLHGVLLRCPDDHARDAFVALVVAAVVALAPREEKFLQAEAARALAVAATQGLAEATAEVSTAERGLVAAQEAAGVHAAEPPGRTPGLSRGLALRAGSRGAVVDFLHALLELLPLTAASGGANSSGDDVPLCSTDEVFVLVQRLATAHPMVHDCLVALDVPARLLYLAVGHDASPPAVRALMCAVPSGAASSQPSGALAQGLPDPMCLVEALMTLAGVRQDPRARLLVEPLDTVATSGGAGVVAGAVNTDASLDNANDSDEEEALVDESKDDDEESPQLTDAAAAALSVVFSMRARPGRQSGAPGMDYIDLEQWFNDLGRDPGANTKYANQVILAQHDTAPDGRLTRRGFVDYYASLCAHHPKEAWAHLHLCGFLNDLSRPNPNSGLDEDSGEYDDEYDDDDGQGGGGNGSGLSVAAAAAARARMEAADLSAAWKRPVPMASREALTSWTLFDLCKVLPGGGTSQAMKLAVAIAHKPNDMDAARTLVATALDMLRTYPASIDLSSDGVSRVDPREEEAAGAALAKLATAVLVGALRDGHCIDGDDDDDEGGGGGLDRAAESRERATMALQALPGALLGQLTTLHAELSAPPPAAAAGNNIAVLQQELQQQQQRQVARNLLPRYKHAVTALLNDGTRQARARPGQDQQGGLAGTEASRMLLSPQARPVWEWLFEMLQASNNSGSPNGSSAGALSPSSSAQVNAWANSNRHAEGPPRNIEVRGAGFAHANGAYDLNPALGLQDGCPVWSLAMGHATAHVYRCGLDNGTCAWFLSSAPRGLRPGTDADTDFYRNFGVSGGGQPGHAPAPELCPPRDGWTSCSRTYEPAPMVLEDSLGPDRSLNDSMGTSIDEDDDDDDDESSQSSSDEELQGPGGGAYYPAGRPGEATPELP